MAKGGRLPLYLMATGPLAFAVFAVGVAMASQANPWWSLYKHAFSDLGGPRASSPWIFNTTLVVSGVLFSLFALGVLAASKTKLEAFSAGLLFTAGVFLALIGVYPSGTKPHAFVSLWFYIQSYLGISAVGLSLALRRDFRYGVPLLLLGCTPIPLAQLVEVTVGWPSVAILELAGAIFILLAAVLYIFYVKRKLFQKI